MDGRITGMETAEAPQTSEPLKPMDPEIAAALLEQHLEFRRFLTSRLGDEAAAEDILQDCLVKASQRGGQLRSGESIVAWFYRILRNAVADHYRSRSADERKHAGLLEEMLAHEADRVHPESGEDSACGCLWGLLGTLKPEYAELLKRVDLGGEAQGAVATSLGITAGNLGVRLHRARQALKTSLERSCGTCAEHGCLDCGCE